MDCATTKFSLIRASTQRIALVVALVLAGCSGDDGAPAAPAFDGARAFAILEQLVNFGPRITDSYPMRKQIELERAILSAAGAEIIEQRWRQKTLDSNENLELVNIIGRFRPELSERVALVTHHDTRREAENDPDLSMKNLAIPGANDSGSGTAILLALAEILGREAPPIGVDLIFFDGEEWGKPGRGEYCQGSRYLAENFGAVYPAPPRWVIAIDMVGDIDLQIAYERNSFATAPAFNQRIWNLARELGSTAFIAEPRWSIEDDHTIFMKRGIPTALMIDYEYRSPDGKVEYYHTHQDALDKCSAASLAQVGAVLLEMIKRESAQ